MTLFRGAALGLMVGGLVGLLQGAVVGAIVSLVMNEGDLDPDLGLEIVLGGGVATGPAAIIGAFWGGLRAETAAQGSAWRRGIPAAVGWESGVIGLILDMQRWMPVEFGRLIRPPVHLILWALRWMLVELSWLDSPSVHLILWTIFLPLAGAILGFVGGRLLWGDGGEGMGGSLRRGRLLRAAAVGALLGAAIPAEVAVVVLAIAGLRGGQGAQMTNLFGVMEVDFKEVIPASLCCASPFAVLGALAGLVHVSERARSERIQG